MNDDVKAAVAAAHARITAIEAKSGGEPDLRIGLWALEKVVDGEDARRAAAVAAATKPLADRIAELERCQRCSREDACFHLCGDCGDEPGVVADLHVAKLRAEAERDTLRARIAELEAQAMDLCMTIGKAREDNLALVADNEKLTAKIKNKG